MRRPWAWALVLASLTVGWSVALSGDSGYTGKRSRVDLGYPYHRVIYPDSLTSGDNYNGAGTIPNAAAYTETLFVAKDWYYDGSVDSTGTSADYIPIQNIACTYFGSGPDTLWIKLLDGGGNTIGSNRWVVGAATVPRRVECRDWVVNAERAVVFQGLLVAPTDGEFWKVETYHAR